MRFPEGLSLTTDPDCEPDEIRAGLVVRLWVPPPRLMEAGDKPYLIVITDPEIFKADLKVSAAIAGISLLGKPTDDQYRKVGLGAYYIEELPSEIQPIWQEEVDKVLEQRKKRIP